MIVTLTCAKVIIGEIYVNGSPSVKVDQFYRDSGSKSPCRWDSGSGIYNFDDHLSYEELTEWNDDEENPRRFEPASPKTPENTVLLRIAIDQIIEEVRAEDPIYGIVLDLVREGYERKEIVKKLDLSQSQAYRKISEAHARAKELYYK